MSNSRPLAYDRVNLFGPVAVNLLAAGDADLLVLNDQDTKFFPTSIVLETAYARGTTATDPIVIVDNGTTGENITASLTITDALDNQGRYNPLAIAANPYVITGTNVVDAITHLTSLTLASALPVASGGTGSNTATFSGANITNLNANNISSGTLDNARTSASSSNGANTIVLRGASGQFSAGTITGTLSGTATQVSNSVTFNNGGGGGASGSTFNGSGALTVSYNTVGAPSTGGANASGTWSINVTGSAGSASTATTASTANALNTGNNYQVNSLGVGTGASGTAGEIRATNNVTAYYSDDRLKTKLGAIEDALSKVKSLSGFYYEANETAQALGYEVKREVGVSAQEVQRVQPEVVAPAPIDDKYLTVRYEKLVPLLIEAIKELSEKVEKLGD